jgi:flagellar hook-associated protein 2
MSSVNLLSSSLDVSTIVSNLMYYERAPERAMQSQVSSLQNKKNAYQSLNTKLAALSDKVSKILYNGSTPLTTPYTYSQRFAESIFAQATVDSSDDTVVSATANGTVSGTYAITVSSLAQAKSMVSSGYADSTTMLGTGTITITPGSESPVTVTVNASNNTLSGIRDAINGANAGVTATVINDGTATPYRLLLTANNSGTANAFTVDSSLSGGPTLSLSENQTATNAQFIVNGISITKSTNVISDVVDGMTFTLKNRTTSAVTLKATIDTSSIISAFNEFVSAYNAANSFITSQFAYNSSTNTAGVLAGDSTLRSIQGSLQTRIIQSISNRFTDGLVAGQAGFTFNRDGSLSLDAAKLQSALEDNFDSVAALFLGDGTPPGGATPSDSRVLFGAKTDATQAGTYAIGVTSLAQQAYTVGSQIITPLSSNETLTISSGGSTANVALLRWDSLNTILSKINSALLSTGIAGTAANDGTGRLKISTNGYGSAQSITVTSNRNGSAGTTGFTTSPATDVGVDIAGTINGHAAAGSGLSLTGAAGQAEEGLRVDITQTTIGDYGSIVLASSGSGAEGAGVMTNLFSLLDGLMDPLSGSIHYATDSLDKRISTLNDQISSFEERMAIKEKLLTEEYSNADEALRLMTVSQTSLSSLISSLSKK